MEQEHLIEINLNMQINPDFGKIIMLNGASSAGKSALCDALQKELNEPFLRFSLDFFMFNSNVLPKRKDTQGPFSWSTMRPKLFDGYFNCLFGLASAGNNLLIDYIIESSNQLEKLVSILNHVDVFLVRVHCPLIELERREMARGDRRMGDAKRDLETVHTFTAYDLEVDSTDRVEITVKKIVTAWSSRTFPAVINRIPL